MVRPIPNMKLRILALLDMWSLCVKCLPQTIAQTANVCTIVGCKVYVRRAPDANRRATHFGIFSAPGGRNCGEIGVGGLCGLRFPRSGWILGRLGWTAGSLSTYGRSRPFPAQPVLGPWFTTGCPDAPPPKCAHPHGRSRPFPAQPVFGPWFATGWPALHGRSRPFPAQPVLGPWFATGWPALHGRSRPFPAQPVLGPWFTTGSSQLTINLIVLLHLPVRPVHGPPSCSVEAFHEPQLLRRNQSAPHLALQGQFTAVDAYRRTAGASRNPPQNRQDSGSVCA